MTKTNDLCSDCNTKMHTNTVLVLGGKNKHYQECAICHFTADAGASTTNRLCPDCNTQMLTNTVLVCGGKDKHYQECPICHFTADVGA